MMKSSIDVKLLIGALTVLSMTRWCHAIVDCTPDSADSVMNTCIRQSPIVNNSQWDCTSAPLFVKQIYDCIAAFNCQLSSSNNQYLNQVTDNVDAYCSGVDSRCTSITERYNNFTNCYSYYGGLATVLDGIVQSFNDYNSTQLYGYCQRLAWGRNCQLQEAGDCPYLKTLQAAGINSDYRTTVAFYVCGSESGLFVYNDTSSCSNSDTLVATVNDQCAVTCDITRAQNNDDVCRSLQSQIGCILTSTAGCSPIESQYIVPRLASYWAANELLGCKVQINGIQVWARAEQCSINSLLTACFNLSISNFRTLDSVKQLFAMQFPISPICNLYQNGMSAAPLTQQCVVAMTSCIIPHRQVYNWPGLNAPQTVYSTTPYSPLLGPFAVNAWGLSTLNSNLQPSICQASGHVQCLTTPTTTTATTTTSTTRGTARPTRRATPISPIFRTTPPSVNAIGQ